MEDTSSSAEAVTFDHDAGNGTRFFLGPSNIETSDENTKAVLTSKRLSITCDLESMDSPSAGSVEDNVESPLPRQITGPDDTLTADSTDHYVAFGSIRLYRDLGPASDSSWSMHQSNDIEHFPNDTLSDLIRRGWLRSEHVDHIYRPDLAVARIYLLPEDVNRAGRASPKPFRKIIRWLTSIVDRSPDTWLGNFDPGAPIDSYGIPSADQEESLFYIFNTLDSPSMNADLFQGSRHAQASLFEVLNGSVPGVTTELYPYQKRSVASMLQREEDPALSQDARKPDYIDLEGNSFHMDVFDGIVVRHSQLYVEPRGGILAETMGYGKTVSIASDLQVSHVPTLLIQTPPGGYSC